MAVAATRSERVRAPLASRELRLLAGIVVLAAALRFATLGVQSLDSDEGFTAEIARKSLGGALSQVPHTESTPPLYYALLWLWAKLFGTSEYALRSLSALAGTLAVPVTYAIGATLRSRRAGLIAAAAAAVSPLLVWYSQEARAYMLFMLLAAVSFWAFARALREPGWLKWWALASGAALATHYFAAVTVLPEAIWLIARAEGPRRHVRAALAFVSVVALALLPLLLYQDAHVSRPWANALSVGDELKATSQSFLVGIEWTWLIHRPGVLLLAAIALALAVLAWRNERAALRLPAAVAAIGLLVPFLGSLIGVKYFTPGNELGVWPLLAVMLAVGAASRRIGLVLAAAGCVAMLAITLAGPMRNDLQREDWKSLVGTLNRAPGPRAIVLASPFQDRPVVSYYLKRESGPLPVRQTVTIVHQRGRVTMLPPAPPAPGTLYQR